MILFADRNAFARLLYRVVLFGALWTLLAAAVYLGDSSLTALVLWAAGVSGIAFAAVRFWNLLVRQELLEERILDREQLLQQQLKDSEERFRQVAENLHLVFWITSPDLGQVFYINPAYADVWQRPCASMFLEPMSWLDAVAPDDKPRIQSRVELLKNGDFSDAQQLECGIMQPDGMLRWVLLKFIPVCSDMGRVMRIIASAEDITGRRHAEQALQKLQKELDDTLQDYAERKQMEDSLRLSESCYHSLFSAMQEGFALYEITGDSHGAVIDCRLIDVNPAFEQLTGLKREMILGRSLAELYPGIEREWIDVLGLVGQTGTAKRFESYSADFSRYYSIVAYRPQALRVAVIFTDITSQKQAESLLKKNELRLESLYSLSKKAFMSESELINFALDEAVRLTESKVGYFHILQDDHFASETTEWSSQARDICRMEQSSQSHCLEHAGLWADCIRKKKPVVHARVDQASEARKFPKDHLEILSHMATPIFENGRIVAVAGVGNKETPYDEADIRQLHLFIDGLWREMARRRAEEQLKQSNAVLEEKVSQRAAELEKINEQIRIENRLREKISADLAESEKRCLQTAELVREVIWEVDREGLFTCVSSACQSVWGYSFEDLTGKLYFYDIHQEQGREEFKNSLFAVFSRREFFRGFLNTVCTKSGKIRLMSTNGMPLFDSAGNFEGYRGLAADITEEMQAQEELRKASACNRNFIETSLDFIAVYDSRGIITDVNNAMETVTGLNRADLLGSHFALHFSEPDKARDVFDHVLREGYVHNCTLEFKHCSGISTPVLYTASVHRDESGEPAGIFTTARDITGRRRTEAELESYRSQLEDIVGKRTQELMREINERKRAEEELRRMNQHLQETTVYAREMTLQAELANSAKSEFLANMSHEIRTPMNAILGLSHLAQQTSLTLRQKDYLSKLDGAAQSLLTIINDILDFSKIEANCLELDIVDFDLLELLENVCGMLNFSAQMKGLELTVVTGRNFPFALRGDPVRIRQIFVNLISNSIKFTHHGDIVVSITPDEETESHVLIRCSVRDTGIGIHHERIASIFKPFIQADGSTSRKYGGTGLGLSISNYLVNKMGGNITVESQPEKGSVFSFDVKLEKQKTSSRMLRLCVNEAARAKVLVVNSNPTALEMLCDLLDSWQCLTTPAASIETALALINRGLSEAKPFAFWDAVILDINNQQKPGDELDLFMDAVYTVHRCPVIILASPIHSGEIKKRFSTQVFELLHKPVKRLELFDSIAAILHVEKQGQEKPDENNSITEQKPDTTTFNILVVEDNPVNQKVIMSMLKKLGLCPDVVSGGKDALEAMRNKVYDLVLMDCQMPEMDGYETTRIIRNDPALCATPDVPIVAMTAHAMPGDREKCINAGMNDYISKPIRKSDLEGVLAKYLGDKGE